MKDKIFSKKFVDNFSQYQNAWAQLFSKTFKIKIIASSRLGHKYS
jgi:hypothetical protein